MIHNGANVNHVLLYNGQLYKVQWEWVVVYVFVVINLLIKSLKAKTFMTLRNLLMSEQVIVWFYKATYDSSFVLSLL